MANPTSKNAQKYLTKWLTDIMGSGVIIEGEVISESPAPLELPPPTIFAEISAHSVIIHEKGNSNE